ncbi:Fasciclin-1 [Gryllus bimaculatus]|nr:Fasciclin-1 [Gryllus bimaculatus]
MLRRDALSSWLCVWLWLWLTAAWPGAAAARAPSIAERLRDDPDLSQLDGSPPLWVTRRRRPGASEEVYINNALVLAARSNFVTQNAAGKQHVLHVVDEVLTPVTTSATAPAQLQLYNPDAFQFLNQSENFDIGKHRVRSFRQRVYFNKKESVFEALGKFTFFVPVDEGFKPPPRPEKIDQKVIDGHVVPGHVLFTRPTPAGQAYDTLAFGDMLRSDTILGDKSHGNGVVMAEIVHPNIPVKNGVVHLIHRPLMVVDNTVKQFLEEKEDGPLYKFYEVIMDLGGDFMQRITNMKELTLFAPSNAAWTDAYINKLLQDKPRLREILDLHLVEERLPVEEIVKNNKNQVPTAIEHKNLYFNVIPGDHNYTLTVEGGGVNATVIQPNIAATNGIVHIIDRVLGVPKRFTYFVPRDLAWKKLEIRFPSTHKKLFMKDYNYHVRQILERHLVVSDQAFTMANLKLRSQNNTEVLPTIRDHLRIKVKELEKRYVIEWEGEKVTVFRPDVECTNGIIHVIDSVLLKERDVSVTGSNAAAPLLLSHLVMLVTAWLLL